jgi:hypothetical protein
MNKYKNVRGIDKVEIATMLEVDGYESVVNYIADKYDVCDRSARGWIARIRKENERIEEEANSEKRVIISEKKAKKLGMHVNGVSSYVDSEGNVKGQWIKESVEEKSRLEALVKAMKKTVKKFDSKPVIEKTVDISDRRIMVKYPFADAHIGLLAKKSEVGADWDLEKSKEVYLRAMQRLVDSAPNSEIGLILDLGDMVHVADSTGKTRWHGHVLDVDGNLEEIYEAALFIVTSMIDLALEKHDKVVFRKTIGNHDGDTSIALGVFLKQIYKNNPRVAIDAGSNLYWWYKWGKTLHFSTHGHTVKQKDLPEIVSHDCKSVWSDCDYVYVDTGHIHHQNVIETRSCICESHNSMVPGDSYNYGSGYRSGRLLKSIVYDIEHGEVCRNIVKVGMVL